MTFSIVATDGAGAFGMAVSSSSPAVAARCIHLRSGTGAAASQNLTDPRLGTALLTQLSRGRMASEAMEDVVQLDPHSEYRQLMVVDSEGGTAHFSGAMCLGTVAADGGRGAVASGNLLANGDVPPAMIAAFCASVGDLERRLMVALSAGLEAGGEVADVRSAGIAVVRDVEWAETDLRVDWHSSPIQALADLVDDWLPVRDDYLVRGLNPAEAPLLDLGLA